MCERLVTIGNIQRVTEMMGQKGLIEPEMKLQARGSDGEPSGSRDLVVLTTKETQKEIICARIKSEMPKTGKTAFIQKIADEYDFHWTHIRRIWNRYQEKGRGGLVHGNKGACRFLAWDTEAARYWLGLRQKREHRKIRSKALYFRYFVPEAKQRGWKFGKYETALGLSRKYLSPQLEAFRNGGIREVDNFTLPPILRKFSDLEPLDVVVGDQHRFNLWVVDEATGELFRPEAYIIEDLCTRAVVGFSVDKHYDAGMILASCKMCAKIFGLMKSFYCDNGASELSHSVEAAFSDIEEQYKVRLVDPPLGFAVDADDDGAELDPCGNLPGHRKAKVGNAKGKPIERLNSTIDGIFLDRGVCGYAKRLTDPTERQEVDQQEIQQLAKAGKLLTFKEFLKLLSEVVDEYNEKRAHRAVLQEWPWPPKPKAATPMDYMKAHFVHGWRPILLSDDALDILFLARDRKGRVVDRGRISFKNRIFEADELIEYHKQRVFIRFDPLDLDWILVFDGQGKPIGEARPVEYGSMKNQELTRRKNEEKARLRKAVVEKHRQLTFGIPDVREFSNVPKFERIAAEVGAGRRRRVIENRELYRELTHDELHSEVRALESEAQKRKPDPQAPVLPPRPDWFASELERYSWIEKFQGAGGELCDEDSAFKAEFETRMTPGELEYWAAVRQFGGAK